MPRTPDRSTAVQVFQIDLDAPGPASGTDAPGLLDPDERRRADRLATPMLRTRFIAAHAATRHILGGLLGVAASDVRLMRDANGKPILDPEQADGLHFNLSHCRGQGLLAVAGVEVGVDIEAWIERDVELLATEILAARERVAFLSTPAPDRPRQLARMWAAKEALLKARGLGLRIAPETVAIHADARGWHRLPGAAQAWWLHPLPVAGPYCAAIACASRVDAALSPRAWTWAGP